MKLRGLLKLVTSLVTILPSTISVVSCGTGSNQPQQANLSAITTITGVSFGFDSTQKYSALDSTVAMATEFQSKQITDFEVKYYASATSTTEITDNFQAQGPVWIVIVALLDDPNWTGSTSNTNRIMINIGTTKTNLDTITTLSGLNITVDPTQTYADLNATLANATEFNTHSLKSGYTVQWYAAASGGSDISTQNQVGGPVYLVITAAPDDSNWTGSTSNTNRISVTINKVNLSTITSLTGLSITVDPTQTYAALNATIGTATEFTSHVLAPGYTVQWYAAASGGNDISTQNQIGGIAYVVLTAANNDPYWIGSTSANLRIAVTIGKVDLNSVQSLTGLTLNVDPSQTYSQFNAMLANATEFSTNALAPGYTVQWYAAASGGSDISTQNQVGGPVYLVITAAPDDPYWTGNTSNTNRISVTVNKNNLSTINQLTNLNLTANNAQNYSALNSAINNATEFATNQLAPGYTVQWYAAASGGSDISNTPQVGGSVYVVITAANNDPYWQGSTSNTTRININLNTFQLIDNTTVGTVNSLDMGSDGTLYAGSANGTVYKLAPGATTFTPMTGTSGSITAVAVDSANNVFAASSDGTVKIAPTGASSFSQTATGFAGTITSITTSKDTTNGLEIIFLGSNNGQVYINIQGVTGFSAEVGTSGNITNVSGVRTINNNFNCYAVSTNGVIYYFIEGKGSFLPTTGTSGNIKALTTDANGNTYAANNMGTIFKATYSNSTPGPFTQISTGVITEAINSMTIDANNNIWVGTINNHIYKSTDGGVSFTLLTGAVGTKISTLVHDSSNTIYTGSDGGVYKGK